MALVHVSPTTAAAVALYERYRGEVAAQAGTIDASRLLDLLRAR